MAVNLDIDVETLKCEIKKTYAQVSSEPETEFIFPTGRAWALDLGYPPDLLARVPDGSAESFAGVANPFALRQLVPGEKVVDAGSGAGFDCFVAARQLGPRGRVVGIDMLPEMLAKSRASARAMGLDQVEFREGLLEEMPVPDGWADVVISNGVINLCVDKKQVFKEIWRVLRPGGHLQFADIANSKPVPASAIQNIDLWTA